jgi:hypothetical protein
MQHLVIHTAAPACTKASWWSGNSRAALARYPRDAQQHPGCPGCPGSARDARQHPGCPAAPGIAQPNASSKYIRHAKMSFAYSLHRSLPKHPRLHHPTRCCHPQQHRTPKAPSASPPRLRRRRHCQHGPTHRYRSVRLSQLVGYTARHYTPHHVLFHRLPRTRILLTIIHAMHPHAAPTTVTTSPTTSSTSTGSPLLCLTHTVLQDSHRQQRVTDANTDTSLKVTDIFCLKRAEPCHLYPPPKFAVGAPQRAHLRTLPRAFCSTQRPTHNRTWL